MYFFKHRTVDLWASLFFRTWIWSSTALYAANFFAISKRFLGSVIFSELGLLSKPKLLLVSFPITRFLFENKWSVENSLFQIRGKIVSEIHKLILHIIILHNLTSRKSQVATTAHSNPSQQLGIIYNIYSIQVRV